MTLFDYSKMHYKIEGVHNENRKCKYCAFLLFKFELCS